MIESNYEEQSRTPHVETFLKKTKKERQKKKKSKEGYLFLEGLTC